MSYQWCVYSMSKGVELWCLRQFHYYTENRDFGLVGLGGGGVNDLKYNPLPSRT